MTEEYEYISEHQFNKLIIELLKSLTKNLSIPNNNHNIYDYEDTMIKVRAQSVYLGLDAHPTPKRIYRVDRKRFLFSKDAMLKDYPNIVYALGAYPDYTTLVRYSKEVGYIVPHIKRLVNDDNYFKQEQVMCLLES
jgi:hypothetical protein